MFNLINIIGCAIANIAIVKPRDDGWRSSLVKSWKSGYMCTRKIKWYMRTRKAHMLPDWVRAYPLTVYVDNWKLLPIIWHICTITAIGRICSWVLVYPFLLSGAARLHQLLTIFLHAQWAHMALLFFRQPQGLSVPI